MTTMIDNRKSKQHNFVCNSDNFKVETQKHMHFRTNDFTTIMHELHLAKNEHSFIVPWQQQKNNTHKTFSNNASL